MSEEQKLLIFIDSNFNNFLTSVIKCPFREEGGGCVKKEMFELLNPQIQKEKNYLLSKKRSSREEFIIFFSSFHFLQFGHSQKLEKRAIISSREDNFSLIKKFQ